MRVKDFQGFRFGKTHTSDLNLEVVSTSNRYEPRILPSPTDTVQDVPGGDGQYYLGSNFKNREIVCNLAFNNVSEQNYRKIRQLFATDKLLDLVFDEEPYKTWRAKIKSKPEFKSICFTDKETGQRIYKGEGKLTFICYYPYAFCFNKYLVRAADYYTLNTPECIINEAQGDETFVKESKQKNFASPRPEDINYHYNLNPSDYKGGATFENIDASRFRDKTHRNHDPRQWKPNGNKPWKGGYPTIEQVQQGELFFDTDDGKKSIIDVRGYWDNVPEWQSTAQLLTTPTLDFEQELIYMPQYSKTNYINMERGFDSENPIIGSRLLVYNPGDLPVDWEIKIDENKRSFWSTRGGTKVRIRRFNVERLPLDRAVDWCGLKTYDPADNEKFKYGTKYFKKRSLDGNIILEELEHIEVDNEFKPLPETGLNIYAPVEKETGYNTRQLLRKDEIIGAIHQGYIPVDKKNYNNTPIPYSKKYDWREIKERDTYGIQQQKLYNKFKNVNVNIKEAPTYTQSFDLRLSDDTIGWGKLLKDTFKPQGLGKSHPNICYYVEPIPREKLGDYIKLFYWQTIQWRGQLTVDGQFVEVDAWKKMLPREFFNQELYEQGIYVPADENNPLIDFLSNFIDFRTDGMVSKNNGVAKKLREAYRDLDFEDGIAFANRYEELYEECVDELEQYELYWDTLKKLLYKFMPIIQKITEIIQTTDEDTPASYLKFDGTIGTINIYNDEQYLEMFIDSYINHPLEYIGTDSRELNYGETIFNGYKLPEWITEDYLEIDQSELSNVALLKQYLTAIEEDEDAIFTGKMMYYKAEDRQRLLDSGNYNSLIRRMDQLLSTDGCLNDLLDDKYYLNTDNRTLYTTRNPYGMEFVYKPEKIIMNDAITQGKWFKLPPGWSLITIEPVVDETLWGGGRWDDARPFDWGYGGDVLGRKREAEQLFDFVLKQAKREFFTINPIETIEDYSVFREYVKVDREIADNEPLILTGDEQDELLKFKIWYEGLIKWFPAKENYFAYEFYRKLRLDAEYSFLKIVNDHWSAISPYFTWTSQRGIYIEPRQANWTGTTYKENAWPTDEDYDVGGLPLRNINGNITDWWWYACNFFWSNFPPPYWSYADILNNAKIEYTPLFY